MKRWVTTDILIHPHLLAIRRPHMIIHPVDNFGTVVGENPTPYGILALWAVNGLSIVYWDRVPSR